MIPEADVLPDAHQQQHGARAQELLSVTDVSLTFGGTTALSGVTFAVQEGHVVGLVGPNGAGKTSLLNCICGYYRPQHGSIRFGGREVVGMTTASVARLGVGRTFQSPQLSTDMSVVDNVMLGRHRYLRVGLLASALNWPSAARKEAEQREVAYELLRFVGLDDKANDPIGALSFAQQKMVELARALALEPTVLLLDEPASGMSAHERVEISTLIRRVRDESKITPIIIEHDVNFIDQLCDRVIVLNFGEVMADGDPKSVFADRRVIEAYVGNIDGEPIA